MRRIAHPVLAACQIILWCGMSTGWANDGYRIVPGDVACPEAMRLASVSDAEDQAAALCNLVPDFSVARLAGLGSLSGPGLNCTVQKTDSRALSLSLCAPIVDFGRIRGVLLNAGFRTQGDLSYMSRSEWRSTLETEIANRLGEPPENLTTLSHDALADVGEVLVFFLRSRLVLPQSLATMGVEDLRATLIQEIAIQTGRPREVLANRPLRALLDMIEQG